MAWMPMAFGGCRLMSDTVIINNLKERGIPITRMGLKSSTNEWNNEWINLYRWLQKWK